MKLCRILLAAMPALSFLAGSGVPLALAQQGPRLIGQDRPPRPGRGPNAGALTRTPIQEIVEGFYVSRFQEELGLNDAQFARVLPELRDSLRARQQLGQRRLRAQNALRQAIANNASEEEIDRRIRDIDEIDMALREVQENFRRSVDPELSPEQRGRMRIVQPNLEQRIRNLIERSREAARPPQ